MGLADLPEQVLMPFNGSSNVDIHRALPFTRKDYFDLVDTTGRIFREGKRGVLRANFPLLFQHCSAIVTAPGY